MYSAASVGRPALMMQIFFGVCDNVLEKKLLVLGSTRFRGVNSTSETGCASPGQKNGVRKERPDLSVIG